VEKIKWEKKSAATSEARLGSFCARELLKLLDFGLLKTKKKDE
jgi:hypothetical protein